ncbi:MAG: hypothetical protein DRO15_04810 [Thermoprotei archaeon]|nr:MAG: hypothetical protein DRO15_04810 [Thermoprotei archaeon]
MSNISIERCPTGIEELDEILRGGFIRNSTVLIAGNPGTGKTIFAAKFIYEGVRKFKEPGVYLSFAESKKDFYMFMKNLGMDFEEIEKWNKFIFIEALTLADESAVERAIESLIDRVVEIKARRAVIDSITAITQVLNPARARALIHNTIVKGLKSYNVTTLLIADLPFGENKVGFGAEEFVVDGVIIFRMERVQELITRYMEIRKMRGIEIIDVEIPFAIIPNKGIQIMLMERPEVLISISDERITTGIEKLDELFRGGLRKGAQLLITGPSGSGKSVLIANIISNLITKNIRTMYVSFDEPPAHILSRIKLFREEINPSLIRIESINPTAYTCAEMTSRILTNINDYKPDLIIMDGLTTLTRTHNLCRLWYYIVNMFLKFKKLGITGIYAYTANYPKEPVPLDTLADAVLIIQYKYHEGIRRIFMSKNRLDPTSTKQLLMRLGENGKLELLEE